MKIGKFLAIIWLSILFCGLMVGLQFLIYGSFGKVGIFIEVILFLTGMAIQELE